MHCGCHYVRDEFEIQTAVETAVKTLGGFDIFVNNDSAISSLVRFFEVLFSIATK